MSVKSLLFLATVLCFGVVGCDDPEVEEKVSDLFEYGAETAQLTCDLRVGSSGKVGTGTHSDVHYRASKLVDGSCFVEACVFSGSFDYSAHSQGQCVTRWVPKSLDGSRCRAVLPTQIFNPSSSYPYRPFVDGYQLYVEDGIFVAEIKENQFNNSSNNCGNGGSPQACTDPFPWFTHDITDPECTGRNLEAFGATP